MFEWNKLLLLGLIFIVIMYYRIVLFSDLILEPNRPIRALTNTTLTLYCLNNFTVMSDGNFHWLHVNRPCKDNKLCNHDNNQCDFQNILCNHNYTICNTTSCRSSIDTPKSSKLTLVMGETTAGNWRCGFIKQKNC